MLTYGDQNLCSKSVASLVEFKQNGSRGRYVSIQDQSTTWWGELISAWKIQMPNIIFQGITMCSLSAQSYQNRNVLTSHDALKKLLTAIIELCGFLINKIYRAH